MSVIDVSNLNPWNALPKALTAAAKTYKGAVDSSYYAMLGVAECTYAGASSACEVWKRGISGNLKELGKACYGINDFSEAKAEMGRSVRKVNEKEERVPLSERIGKASAHIINGGAKIVATNCGGLTYASGVALNALGIQGENGSLVQAATMTATGINTVARFGFRTASALADPVFSAVGSTLSMASDVVYQHPAGACATVASGALLYVAADQAVRVSESKSRVGQAAHGAIAALAALSSAGPLLWNAGIVSSPPTIIGDAAGYCLEIGSIFATAYMANKTVELLDSLNKKLPNFLRF